MYIITIYIITIITREKAKRNCGKSGDSPSSYSIIILCPIVEFQIGEGSAGLEQFKSIHISDHKRERDGMNAMKFRE